METSLKNIVYSFIQSIDLFNFLLKNHHKRVATISWHIGKELKLSDEQMGRLILSASMHDIGALSVEERDELIQMDIENPHPHARLGAYMLESFEPFKPLSKIVFYHHWPYEYDAYYTEELGPAPIEAYIIHLADRVDISIDQNIPILLQSQTVISTIMEKKGTLFHPEVCDAFQKVSKTNRFWLDVDNKSMSEVLGEVSSSDLSFEMTMDLLEQLAFTISKMIDCRSKFTIAHSFGVSEVAYKIAEFMKYKDEDCKKIRVAGLLHDIGKIGIDMRLINKGGPLSIEERIQVQEHAYFTNKILYSIKELRDIADWASHHHEDHQGGGYPDNIKNESISEEMDILAYADIFTALTEDRPYRHALPLGRTLEILHTQFEAKHGSKVLDVIDDNSHEIYKTCRLAIVDGITRYSIYEGLEKKYQEEYGNISCG